MKKFTLFILLVTASIFTYSQSRQDQAQILQKCIDVPELQQYFPEGADGSFKQICILQHGVSFPLDVQVSKFGKNVQLLNKSQLSELKVDSYFLFWTFKIEESTAHVDFVYNYLDSDKQAQTQNVVVDLQKRNETWIVLNTKMERK